MILTITPRVFLTLVTVAAVVALPSDLRVEAQRQQDNRALRMQEIKELPAKSKRFALVVGVDEYQDEQISRLSGATNDAKALAAALVRYAGFPSDQVILLASDQPRQRQPNRGNILQYLSNLRGIVPEDGLLVVFFAGHGVERGGRGFLCPSDARIGGSVALLEATGVPVDTVREWIRETGVRQVLIILDACRNDPSGRGGEENRLTDSFAQQFNFDVRNKEVSAFATLYATDVGHVAYEYKEKNQGYFTWLLVEGMKGEAANEKGEVTLGGLVKYVQEQVPKRVRLDMGQERVQRPYATIGGYKADELVISITVRERPVTPRVSAFDPAAVELEFWNSTKNSPDVDDFKEYLAKYPNGTFAGLARNKIRTLEAAAKSSAVQPKNEAKPTATEAKPVSSGGPSAAGAGPGGLPLRSFEFDVVTVNSSGSITNRRKGQSRYCDEQVNGIDLALVEIPGGTFLMGNTESEADRVKKELERYGFKPKDALKYSRWEVPQHTVSVPTFYMAKYEVTQAQWRAVTHLPRVNRDLVSDPSKFKGDNLPVEQVSWEDATEFCARLSRASGRIYRLPTEAEWEYACRGGMTTTFYFGDTATPELVNYNGGFPYGSAAKGTNRQTTTPAGGVGYPNAFGLYDMHGNVWEWCMDYWHESYSGAPTDGRSWESGGDASLRVLRGGSWYCIAGGCRSSLRLRPASGLRDDYVGFRVVVGARTP
ncbi:MAG: SUMF1/EgtB/PvdO family nonheme iron enzyme [Acidobacteriota bacterium]